MRRLGKRDWDRKWKSVSIFLPGKFHGQRNLGGYSQSLGLQRVGYDWVSMQEQGHAYFTHLIPLSFTYRTQVQNKIVKNFKKEIAEHWTKHGSHLIMGLHLVAQVTCLKSQPFPVTWIITFSGCTKQSEYACEMKC